MWRTAVALAAAVAGAVALARHQRLNPAPCPYGQRLFVQVPRPGLTRGRLAELLEPRPGEHLLEVGPGTGHYTFDVARRLEPGGRLDIVDVQQDMLDHTLRGARERGLDGVRGTLADARELPFADASFDGAFLVTVLGEVPDQTAALRELRRVLKPGGRIVVGEIALDPHVVTRSALRARAAEAGLRVERSRGSALSRYDRLTPA